MHGLAGWLLAFFPTKAKQSKTTQHKATLAGRCGFLFIITHYSKKSNFFSFSLCWEFFWEGGDLRAQNNTTQPGGWPESKKFFEIKHTYRMASPLLDKTNI